MSKSALIRLLFSTLLLIGIYIETGIFTVIAFALIMISNEVFIVLIRQKQDKIQ